MNDGDSFDHGPQSPVGSAPGLLVYIPSVLLDGRSGKATDFLNRLKADPDLEGWTFRTFHHGIRPWSNLGMSAVAKQLAVQIKTWSGETLGQKGPNEIILVGHSIGGLILRQAFLLDWGERNPNSWSSKVQRIVLLATPNAGFHRKNLPWHLRAALAVASVGPPLTAEDIESGSDFITDLRLRWFSTWADGGNLPRVVQVLGDHDTLISSDDVLDSKFLPDTAQIDVPGAGHADLVDLSSSSDPTCRYMLLKHAVRGNIAPEEFDPQERTDEPVFFLLHGIRSSRYGNWVGKLTDALCKDLPTATSPAPTICSPSYGYFSAAEFAVPWMRKRNMRHFLHWYGNLYVTHQSDNMYFAGHSNGTYMLGRALFQVPSIRFRRIYLAASVLPRDFPWSTIVERGQVGPRQAGTENMRNVIHSDRASKDIPVGWLCSALNGLGMHDIGTGGYDGFDQSTAALYEHDKAFPGDHGAAFLPMVPKLPRNQRNNLEAVQERRRKSEMISAARIKAIADFLKDGTLETEGSNAWPTVENVRWFGRISRLLGVISLPVAVGSAVAIIYSLLRVPSRTRKVRLAVGAMAAWIAARSF